MDNYLNQIKKNVWMQIGTNDGNDNFLKHVSHFKPKKVILIEANSLLIDQIHMHYAHLKNICEIIIINKTIYTEDDKTLSLFLPAQDGIYGKPGVQPNRKQGNHLYTHGQFSLLPMNDWGEKKDMIEIKSEGITFETLCSHLNIRNIDYLQIDTEGFDSEIIKSIHLDQIDISIIRYEKWYFTEDCFSLYNDSKEKYGLNGMLYVKDKLEHHNYVLHDIRDLDGDDIIAVKI